MASNDERKSIIDLTGCYHIVEYPWNKLSISKLRKEAISLTESLSEESTDFIVRMTIFRNLIMNELLEIHGDTGYYNSIDGGKLDAILLITDNFIRDQKRETAVTLHNLILDLDESMYVPRAKKCVDTEDNIIFDVWYIQSFLEDWCLTSGNNDWLH